MSNPATATWGTCLAVPSEPVGERGVSDLERWPRGLPAVVHAFAPVQDDEHRRIQHRLAELGFLPGETVQVLFRGWFRRGPVVVRVGESTFALRAHEAAQLRVRALAQA